ncbi:hypothetical protein L7F22_012470, partial [Adiantum nelumboides]|nr:hypothetical protein [Adiantum nelumboides]
SEMEDTVDIDDTLEVGMESLNCQAVEEIEGARPSADVSRNDVSTTTEVIASTTKSKKVTKRKFRQEWVNTYPFVFQVIRNDGKEAMKCAWCTKYKVKGPWGKGNGCTTIMKSAIRKHQEMPIQHDYSSYTNMMAGKEFIFCISKYLDGLQKRKLLQSPYYSLMVDETTDRSLEKHLIIYFSFLAPTSASSSSAEIAFAKLLTVSDGCAQTKFDAIMKMIEEVGLNRQQLVGIATDGDSSMLGCHDGLVAKMKREIPHLMSVHCIAHREALAVLDAVKCFPCLPYIDKIANKVYSWISGSSVRHSCFQSLLKEMHLQVLEVLSIHDVRWIARGNVMERLTQLMPAILSFWKDNAKS